MKAQRVVFILFCFLSVGSGGCTQSVTDDIVIVGVDSYDRISIAKQVQNICALNPKVLAIDIQFPTRETFFEDSVLRHSLSLCSQVVLPTQIKGYTHQDKNYEDTLGCDPFFLHGAKTGFVNVILEDDDFYTLKRFSTMELLNGTDEYHFAVRTAMSYDSMKTMRFLKRNQKLVEVQYQRDQTKFKRIRASYALYNELSPGDIEGKIILLGQFWPIDGYQSDVFVSPLNATPEKGADMWGVMYLANIVAQVLQ